MSWICPNCDEPVNLGDLLLTKADKGARNEGTMVLTNHHELMHDIVQGLGKEAREMDNIPRVPLSDLNPWASCKERLLILFQSRVGTTWLCQLLENTGVLGHPRESLYSSELLQRYNDGEFENLNETVEASVKEHSTSNGVYSAKSPFFSLAPMFLLEEFPRNINRWKIVFIKRRDELSQAISIHKLKLNQQAASWQEAAIDITDEDYDFQEISNQLTNVRRANYAIETMVRAYNANSMDLYYEDISANPENAIRQIGKFTGVEIGKIDLETRFEVQRDEISTLWKKRWMTDVMDENPLGSRVRFFY